MTDDEALYSLAYGKETDLIPNQVCNVFNDGYTAFNVWKAVRFLAKRIYDLEHP